MPDAPDQAPDPKPDSARFAERPGETRLEFDPAARADASVAFIGRIRSPWSPGDCPRNIRLARETGRPAAIELDPAYAPGLEGLAPGQAVMLLYWMDRGRRDLVVQSPRHADGPRGVFALRSPVRPNPIALSAATLTAVDAQAGRLEIDAIDCFDGTPLVDIKPWIPTVDRPAEAQD